MSKLLLTLAISSLALSSLLLPSTLNARPSEKAASADRAELRAIKMEKAKLHTQERLLKLKTALKLNENQMGDWKTYSDYMTSTSNNKLNALVSLKNKLTNAESPPTSIELAKLNITRLENKLSGAKNQLQAFSKLYKILDKAQRETVDKLARRKVHREAKSLRKAKMMAMKSQKMKRQQKKKMEQ